MEFVLSLDQQRTVHAAFKGVEPTGDPVWSTSDDSVIALSATGYAATLRGLRPGTAQVTATLPHQDGDVVAMADVSVVSADQVRGELAVEDTNQPTAELVLKSAEPAPGYMHPEASRPAGGAGPLDSTQTDGGAARVQTSDEHVAEDHGAEGEPTGSRRSGRKHAGRRK